MTRAPILINRTPVFFAHSGRAAYDAGEGYLTKCTICAREITAPWEMQHACIWCLYCGMERGQVPMVEIRGGCLYSFGITVSECAEIRGWPQHRDIDDLFTDWMRRNGQILFQIGW